MGESFGKRYKTGEIPRYNEKDAEDIVHRHAGMVIRPGITLADLWAKTTTSRLVPIEEGIIQAMDLGTVSLMRWRQYPQSLSKFRHRWQRWDRECGHTCQRSQKLFSTTPTAPVPPSHRFGKFWSHTRRTEKRGPTRWLSSLGDVLDLQKHDHTCSTFRYEALASILRYDTARRHI